MDPREFKPGLLRPNMAGAPIIGPQQIQVMVSHLCVNCFPKPVPAVFMWSGMSLCEKCFVPLRKEADAWPGPDNGRDRLPLIEKRDYEKTWGKKPTDEGEVNGPIGEDE